MTTTKTVASTVTAVTAAIQRHPVLTFYALAFAISWGIVLLLIGGAGGIPGTSAQAARLFPPMVAASYAGPAIAGLLLTGLISGRAGFRELFFRLRTWRVGARWYAVALLIAPLVWTEVLLALSPISSVFRPSLITTSDTVSLVLLGIVGGLIVASFEELGWTGFATPRLRRRCGLLTTGLLVGVLWGAFYLPVYDLWDSVPSAGAVPMALFLTLNGVSFLVGQYPPYRVLMVWVYDHTGSLLLAIFMHTSLLASMIICATAATGAAYLIAVFAVALVLWLVVVVVAVANGRRRAREEHAGALPSVTNEKTAVPA